jgi:hypothetical protein
VISSARRSAECHNLASLGLARRSSTWALCTRATASDAAGRGIAGVERRGGSGSSRTRCRPWDVNGYFSWGLFGVLGRTRPGVEALGGSPRVRRSIGRSAPARVVVAARAALQRFARLGLQPWSDVFRGRLTGAQATLADGPGLRKGDEQRHVARIGPDALAGSRGFRPKASIGNGNPGTLKPSASKHRAFTEKKVERLQSSCRLVTVWPLCFDSSTRPSSPTMSTRSQRQAGRIPPRTASGTRNRLAPVACSGSCHGS